MPVQSSSYVVKHGEPDGSRFVVETHVLTTGENVEMRYIAAASADLSANMLAHAAQIGVQLADAEAATIIGGTNG